ncbi:MAG: hypothetical protein RMK15_11390, partial [Chloroflexota bacterium]|nr:hypothetical protein [Dehalococcoidia bacterium]MDW8047868.1 hypothetical protein [Chloroflexota bacterium]
SDPGLPDAAEICPTNAIVETHQGWTVVDELCIRCGACREVAPNALKVTDRFAEPVPQPAAAG